MIRGGGRGLDRWETPPSPRTGPADPRHPSPITAPIAASGQWRGEHCERNLPSENLDPPGRFFLEGFVWDDLNRICLKARGFRFFWFFFSWEAMAAGGAGAIHGL